NKTSSSSFVVSNTGNQTLEVSNIQVSDAAFDAHPKTFSVAPGASLTVNVDFHPTQAAVYQVDLNIVSNSKFGAPAHLLLKAVSPNLSQQQVGDGQNGGDVPPGNATPQESSGNPSYTNYSFHGLGGCSLILDEDGRR